MIQEVFDTAALTGEEEYKLDFHATRIIKGYFGGDMAGAIKFVENHAGDRITPEVVEIIWDRVTVPAWHFESLAKKFPPTWCHPGLKLRNANSRIRTLAGIAYWVQCQHGDKEFPLMQDALAKALGTTQQRVGAMLQHLAQIDWVTKRPGGSGMANLYKCHAAILDTECGQD
jgi:hypothetical protein